MAHYLIVSKLNGLVLDIEGGSSQPGARVITFHKHNKDNQLWYDDPSTGTIRSKLNGFCLDIEGDQRLRVMPYQPGDPNQQWERDPQGYIRNRVHRNKVLDIARANTSEGADICMWDATNGQNQQWNFEFVGSSQPAGYAAYPGYPAQQPYPGQQYPAQGYPGYPQTGASIQRREFYIVSEMNGKVLDVKGGAGNAGDDIITWSKHANRSKNQLWYSDAQGFIRSAINDYAMDGASGKKVEVQPFNGGPTQQWVFEGNKVINRSNGECLDIFSEKNHDGAEVGSWKWKDGKNQHWRQEFV